MKNEPGVIRPSKGMTTAFMRNPVAIGHYIRAVGRLAPGVALARGQADMTGVADGLAKERSNRAAPQPKQPKPKEDRTRGDLRNDKSMSDIDWDID